MNELTEQKQNQKPGFSRWFRLCPVRHVLSLLGLAVIAAYLLLRTDAGLMQAISDGFVRPYHRAMSRLCSHLPFSVAEESFGAGRSLKVSGVSPLDSTTTSFVVGSAEMIV